MKAINDITNFIFIEDKLEKQINMNLSIEQSMSFSKLY